ncbi:MAG: spore coat associated protein CotJA [Clostridium sp.]|uniref:spore coat associated protein CotJA n=1 Tax=Clostridium culturomicium TaxID=1499683 RepID=UPI0009DEAF23|nr:spore coat associated protein CotJA [Clostridium culturomicium]MDU4890569.1 spore coat associated protein CotJA [Clostridium sp.]MDU7083989.1 spore coat associated protein CotJA [Clostridium sp.]
MTKTEKQPCVKIKYACAFVLPQSFENLFCIDDAFKMGTIFKDLYRPYHPEKRSGYN